MKYTVVEITHYGAGDTLHLSSSDFSYRSEMEAFNMMAEISTEYPHEKWGVQDELGVLLYDTLQDEYVDEREVIEKERLTEMSDEFIMTGYEGYYDNDEVCEDCATNVVQVYTKAEAARIIGVSQSTINKWMLDGRIAYARVMHNNRLKVAIPLTEVARFINRGTPQEITLDTFAFITSYPFGH